MTTFGEGQELEAASTKDGLLLCPTCGFDYLHHDRVTTHSRAEDEDEDAAVRVVDVLDERMEGGGARRPPSNPSKRRSGVVIEGWCEGCDQRWMLTLAQHKGQTQIDFYADPAED